MNHRDTSLGGAGVNFAETVWGMIERARDGSPDVRQAGLDELARSYWKPVYHYLRVAWAKSNEDAKDLTQAFFLWLTDRQALDKYAPERGSFRTFLKALLRHFVQHHDEALDRLKRGGGRVMIPLDEAVPQGTDPDQAFEKEWRNAVMSLAVDRVRRRAGDRFRVFDAYYLGGDRPTYTDLAAQLKMREGEVKHLLEDYREEVRNEIRAELARSLGDFQEEWNAFCGT